MSAHTPGPWKTVEHSWARTSIYCGNAPICSLSIEETATEENQEDLELEMAKHARLIAASPEMLEALKELVAEHDETDRNDTGGIILARHAIAKAEGSR